MVNRAGVITVIISIDIKIDSFWILLTKLLFRDFGYVFSALAEGYGFSAVYSKD